MDDEGLIGFVVGRARKKRCETWWSASTVAITAAAPAVYAKQHPEGRLSKALAEFAVVPTTWRSARLASVRLDLTGERKGAFLKYGDGEGLSFICAGPIILELSGVSDIASSKIIVEVVDSDCLETSQWGVIVY
jgi:hypothetical protein